MKISNRKLAIGIPCTFPTVPTSFFYSFLFLERPDFEFIHGDNGPVDTLRNDIVEKALQTGVTDLIMMDVDMIYHPKTITRLMSHRLPVVAALCFRRYPPFDSIMLTIGEDEKGRRGYTDIDDWKEGELVEVEATGAGCIMYDMSVFRKMPRPWFRFQRNPFHGAPIGEDVGFCQDLREAGYKIFVDTTVPAAHLTTMAVSRQTNLLYRAMKTEEHKRNLERALDTNIPKGGNDNG
jgi:hypothetical protein